METLKQPIQVGRRTFDRLLRFIAEPGVSYYLSVSPGKKTRTDIGHRLDLILRQEKR